MLSHAIDKTIPEEEKEMVAGELEANGISLKIWQATKSGLFRCAVGIDGGWPCEWQGAAQQPVWSPLLAQLPLGWSLSLTWDRAWRSLGVGDPGKDGKLRDWGLPFPFSAVAMAQFVDSIGSRVFDHRLILHLESRCHAVPESKRVEEFRLSAGFFLSQLSRHFSFYLPRDTAAQKTSAVETPVSEGKTTWEARVLVQYNDENEAEKDTGQELAYLLSTRGRGVGFPFSLRMTWKQTVPHERQQRLAKLLLWKRRHGDHFAISCLPVCKTSEDRVFLEEVSRGERRFGIAECVVTLRDTDPDRVHSNLRWLDNELFSRGYRTEIQYADVESQKHLPVRFLFPNRKKSSWLLDSVQAATFFPTRVPWAGELDTPFTEDDWQRPSLLPFVQENRDGFGLDWSRRENQNVLLLGPEGSGKSTLSIFWASLWLRDPNARVVLLAKDEDLREVVSNLGGNILDLRETPGWLRKRLQKGGLWRNVDWWLELLQQAWEGSQAWQVSQAFFDDGHNFRPDRLREKIGRLPVGPTREVLQAIVADSDSVDVDEATVPGQSRITWIRIPGDGQNTAAEHDRFSLWFRLTLQALQAECSTARTLWIIDDAEPEHGQFWGRDAGYWCQNLAGPMLWTRQQIDSLGANGFLETFDVKFLLAGAARPKTRVTSLQLSEEQREIASRLSGREALVVRGGRHARILVARDRAILDLLARLHKEQHAEKECVDG